MSKKDQQEPAYPDEGYSGEAPAEEQPGPEAGNGEVPAGEQPSPEAGSGEPPDEEPPDGNQSEPPENKDTGPGLLTIEEHAARLKTPASVAAAVKQTCKWAAGKKVTEAAFKTAVEEFLGAPIGGRKAPPPENKEQK